MTLEEPVGTRELPQDAVARMFMEAKGYPEASALDIEKLDGTPCWYFFYELHDGDLELEVFYDDKAQEWICTVTSFTPPSQ